MILPVLSFCMTINQNPCEHSASRLLYLQTSRPAHPSLPFPAVTGRAETRQESDGCDEESQKVRKRRNERASTLVLLSPGGSACLAIRENLSFKWEILLNICLPMRRKRKGRLFLLSSSSNKDKEKYFSFLCGWGDAKPATGRQLITHVEHC